MTITSGEQFVTAMGLIASFADSARRMPIYPTVEMMIAARKLLDHCVDYTVQHVRGEIKTKGRTEPMPDDNVQSIRPTVAIRDDLKEAAIQGAAALYINEEAAEYARKAQAMAAILYVIRQRGDNLPDSYAMQCYDAFVNTLDAVYRKGYESHTPDSSEAEVKSYDPNLRTSDAQIAELRTMMLELVETVRAASVKHPPAPLAPAPALSAITVAVGATCGTPIG